MQAGARLATLGAALLVVLLGLTGCSAASDEPLAMDAGVDGGRAIDGAAQAVDAVALGRDAPASDTSSADRDAASACVATICLEGAGIHETGGNPYLGELCEQIPGLIRECVGSLCYPRFGMLASDAAFEALFARLDQNQDGRYDEADPACEVQILGYSWGGVNATQIAERLLSDPRVAPSRRVVHKLIVIDPYIPLAEVRVAEGVVNFWEYRHSIAPTWDCSAGVPLGPYLGLAPLCHHSVRCVDYDYSLAPDQHFYGRPGAEIGHCNIVKSATPSILHNIGTGQDDPAAPPSVLVETF